MKKKCKDRRRFNKGRFPKKELDIKLLRKLCHKETPQKELMRIFNCSKATIQRNIKKHVPKKYWKRYWQKDPKNPLNKKITKLYANHHFNTYEIGQELGWGDEKARQRLIYLGIERRRNYKNLNRIHPASFSNNPSYYLHADAKLLNKQIKSLYLKTGSMQHIASELGIDRGTVTRRLNFMNVSKIKIKRNSERNNAIKELYEDNKNSYSIAKKFNLSSSQVMRILYDLGVKIRKKTRKNYLECSLMCSRIKTMHLEDKMSIVKIAKKFGVCWNTVNRYLIAMGIKNRRYNNFDEQTEFNAAVKRLYAYEGLNGHQVAKMLNCSAPKVYNRIKYLGIKIRNASQYFTEKEKKQHKRVIFWYKKGLTIPSVSKIEKMPQSTIYYLLERNGIKMRRTRESRNRKAIVFMALRNPKKYMQYADFKIGEIEKKGDIRRLVLNRRKVLQREENVLPIDKNKKIYAFADSVLVEV